MTDSTTFKDDINMIQKQTGVDETKALEAYQACGQDAVQAIIYSLNGGSPPQCDNKSQQTLDPVQQKIAEFREILNKKDQIFDTKVVKK